MATVELNGGETGRDGFLGALIGAMVQMQRNGNRDVQLLNHGLDHRRNGGVAAHILGSAFAHTQNHGGVQLLSGRQDRLGPFQVVDVEMADGITAFNRLGQHFLCRYQSHGNSLLINFLKVLYHIAGQRERRNLSKPAFSVPAWDYRT